MQFDLWLPTASPMTTPELLDAVARGAEDRGIGTIWVGEHVVLFPEYASSYPYAEDGRIPAPPGSGLLEPLVTLTYLAARTTTVRLGTAMLLLPQRNPVYVAKEVATLDWLSGGRVDLGVGVGWLKEEFEALNVPWERRGRRTDEYLEVLHTLWVDDTSSFHGETYTLDPCEMFPKPVQQPRPRPHRGRDAGRPAPGRPRRPGLAHLQPHARRAGHRAGRAGRVPRGGRAQPRRPAHHRLPLLQAAHPRAASSSTPRPAPTPWPPSSSPSRSTTWPGPSTTSTPASRRLAASAADPPVPAGPRRPAPTLALCGFWRPPMRCPPTRRSACSPTTGPGWSIPSTSAWRRHQAVLRAALTASIPYLVRRRALPPGARVGTTVRHLGGALALWAVTDRRKGGEASVAGLSRRLRTAFEKLGPTYIKLGQIVASGDGVFPPALVAEFKWCRDQVPAEPWPVVERVLSEELGRPLSQVFASVEHTPLAAASIAQVHAATLRDGTPVVIKVQRPTVARRVRQDLAVMAWVAPAPGRPHPRGRPGQPARPGRALRRDHPRGARLPPRGRQHADVAHVFAELGQRSFVVPRPHPTLVTRRMLVMERVDGFNFADVAGMRAAGIDTEEVVRAGMIGFLEGAMLHGVFHGDLHAGNLFVLPSGKTALLDFGITGRLTEPKRLALLSLIVGASNGDIPTQVAAMRDLGAFPDDAHVDAGDRAARPRPPADRPHHHDARRAGGRNAALHQVAARPRRPHAQGAHALRQEHDVPRWRHRHPGARPRPVRRVRVHCPALRGQARRAHHVPARPRGPGGLGARPHLGQGQLRPRRVAPRA